MKENPLFRPTPAESARLNRIASVPAGAVRQNVVPGAQPGRSVVLTKLAAAAVARPSAPAAHFIQRWPAAPAIRLPNIPVVQQHLALRPPIPASQAPQPCISGRPNGPASYIQAKISWNGSAGAFQGDGDRPGWRKHLIRHATDHYNKVHNTSHPPNVDFVSLGSDRTHKYPYDQIEKTIVKFCNSGNNSSDRQALQEMCQSVMTISNARYGDMGRALKALIVAVPQEAPATIGKLANKLLSELNSSTDNVLAGLDTDNRGIGNQWDLNYQKTPGGTHFDMTPKGKNMFEVTTKYGLAPTLPLTPTGQHYRTSQYGSEKPLVASTLIPNVTSIGFSFSTNTTQVATTNNSQPSQTVTTNTNSQPTQTTTQPTSSISNQGFGWQGSQFSSQVPQQLITVPQYSFTNPPPKGHFYPSGFWYWPGYGPWVYFQPGMY
jgi:hypothetical protein